MRIISGELGGRRIKIPRNLPIRPTTDLAKEGIFNIVSNKVNLEDLKILDLFSGSGWPMEYLENWIREDVEIGRASCRERV